MLTQPHSGAIRADTGVHAEELRDSEFVQVEDVLTRHRCLHVDCRGTIARHAVLEC